LKALNPSAEMHDTLHFSTWSRSDLATSSAFFSYSRISSTWRSNGAWTRISPVSGSKGGMPETKTMLPAPVQVDTGAPHFEIAVNRLEPDHLSFHKAAVDSSLKCGPPRVCPHGRSCKTERGAIDLSDRDRRSSPICSPSGTFMARLQYQHYSKCSQFFRDD
jgi:hypothetical protein